MITKYYKVRINGQIRILSNLAISNLEEEGEKIKIIRKATYSETKNRKR